MTSRPAPLPTGPPPRFGPRASAPGERKPAGAGTAGWRPPFLALVLLATAQGCGRSTDGPATATDPAPARPVPPPVAATDSAPAAPEPAAGEAVDAADLPAVLAGLTQAARRYGLEQRRAPAGLEELVAKGYLARIPEAPGGGRFVIDKQLQVRLEK